MSNVQRSTISRRRALKTSGFAALAAGLIGATPGHAEPVSPPPANPTIATVVNYGDLGAETGRLLAQMEQENQKFRAAERRLDATLTDEQRKLYLAALDAFGNTETTYHELTVAEMARHIPGLAFVIRETWRHVIDTYTDEIGECCE